MYLAFKEIKKEKGRFLLVIGIVTLISYLVFFLTGLAYGLAKDNTTAIEHWSASKIVLKSGSNNNIFSSMIDVEKLKVFDSERTTSININRSAAYINGDHSDANTINLVLIGMDKNSKAYPKVIQWEKTKSKDEVLATIALQKEYDVELGDELVLSMNDRKFKVVGFTDDSKFNVSPVIYTELQEASSAMMSFRETKGNQTEKEVDQKSSATQQAPERVAAVLIHGNSDFESDEEFDVLTIDEFINKLPGYTAQVLTFGFMIGFLILISSVVLGVFMFIITMQKKQVFGVMKVQGISNSYISKSVVFQTIIISLLGVIIGLLLTIISEVFLPYTVPFRSNYIFYLIISFAILVISLLGAVFSVRAVTKVDPLEVLE